MTPYGEIFMSNFFLLRNKILTPGFNLDFPKISGIKAECNFSARHKKFLGKLI